LSACANRKSITRVGDLIPRMKFRLLQAKLKEKAHSWQAKSGCSLAFEKIGRNSNADRSDDHWLRQRDSERKKCWDPKRDPGF
jgi:hypothetical protein